MMESIYDRTVQLGEYVPEPDDDRIICRCEEYKRRNQKSSSRWNVYHHRDQKISPLWNGALPGTDLRQAGKEDRGGRAWSFPGTSGTGNLKSSHETLRDENLRKGR